MVLCQYFLNNTCRFGSKCNNEHLDIRATIKQEMEAAIKGRQWPLSVFGPFKEKSNLIPDEYDLSFEECRLQFLESQAQNNFQIYHQQLMHKIQEANTRMQSLLNVNKDVLLVAVNIYNNNNNANSGTISSTSNLGSNRGVFAGNTNNSFGGFSSAASIFGGGKSSSQNSSNGSFGSTFSSHQNVNNTIFSGGNQTSMGLGMNTKSIFGGSISNCLAPSSSSLFGAISTTEQQNPASLFAQSSTFGYQEQKSNVLNAPPAFGSSTFGNVSITPSGLFSNAAVSMFGSQTVSQNSKIFDNHLTAQPNLTSSSSFGGSSTPFASQLQPTISQPVSATNIFGNLGQQVSQAALATVTNQINNSQQVSFGLKVQSSSFEANTNQMNDMQKYKYDQNVYTKMEAITSEELAAFQASEFILGQIPNVPPPRELC
ncbi:uncharacterized protein LOC134833209 [Culicoides brevitarsis]|uniref:uncharacterized protein LOC134833209 n=1 Tax=Culicoides brevitarsis TaxID=469753 RepID=UPI00307C8590